MKLSGMDSCGMLQRKLQRAYAEKELLLAEIQAMKQQVKIANNSAGQAVKAAVNVPPDSQGAWDELLNANMKSGTLSCVLYIKVNLVKTLARAFNWWKYTCTRPLLSLHQAGNVRTLHVDHPNQSQGQGSPHSESVKAATGGRRRSHLCTKPPPHVLSRLPLLLPEPVSVSTQVPVCVSPSCRAAQCTPRRPLRLSSPRPLY